jgi:hypothetical protein
MTDEKKSDSETKANVPEVPEAILKFLFDFQQALKDQSSAQNFQL